MLIAEHLPGFNFDAVVDEERIARKESILRNFVNGGETMTALGTERLEDEECNA